MPIFQYALFFHIYQVFTLYILVNIFLIILLNMIEDFPCGLEGKASACNAGDLGLIPGSETSPGEGNGNPLQYPCLENPMYRGAW